MKFKFVALLMIGLIAIGSNLRSHGGVGVTSIVYQFDLDLQVAIVPDSLGTNGNTLHYLITVQNLGPDEANEVTVQQLFPPTLQVVSINASQGSCGSPEHFSCNLGRLEPGATATILVEVHPLESGEYSMFFQLSYAETFGSCGKAVDVNPDNNYQGLQFIFVH